MGRILFSNFLCKQSTTMWKSRRSGKRGKEAGQLMASMNFRSRDNIRGKARRKKKKKQEEKQVWLKQNEQGGKW